jgi:hypothetical protein
VKWADDIAMIEGNALLRSFRLCAASGNEDSELTFAIVLLAEIAAMACAAEIGLAVPEPEGGWGFHDGLEVGREAASARCGDVR